MLAVLHRFALVVVVDDGDGGDDDNNHEDKEGLGMSRARKGWGGLEKRRTEL